MRPIQTTSASISILPLFLTAACSGTATSSLPGSGGQGDSGTSTVAEAGVRYEAGTVPGFVSNTPGATVQDVGNPPTPDLKLISLNFLQQPSAGQYYQQWLGEVTNVGTTPLCQISLQITYQGAGGKVLITPGLTFVDGPPWVLPSGDNLSMACLDAGQTGTFYTNGFASNETSLADVTTIAVAFTPQKYPTAFADPNAPTISSSVEPYLGAYALTGTMVGGAGPINNIELHGYPRDATGLVLAQLSATDLGQLNPGSSFPFTTATVAEAFTEYRQFPDYIEGAATGAIVVRGDAEAPRMAAVELARRSARAEVVERAARR
jgi:hypothetical protein